MAMSSLIIRERLLQEVYLLEHPSYFDRRGSFAKIFHSQDLEEQGVEFTPAESFLTKSASKVLRGMHFQAGEAAHEKLVCCPKGRVLDVVVGINPDSPDFNRPIFVELSGEDSSALLIGKDYAHGFLSLSDDSWMFYHTSTVHCPELDRGVLWSSINFDWPIKSPLLSQRDLCHPPIDSLR